MLIQPNKIVIISRGRLAGTKAVILSHSPKDNSIVVCGVSKYPKKTNKKLNEYIRKKREAMITFVKKINIKHVIVTRYKSNMDFKNIDTNKVFEDKLLKKDALKRVKTVFKSEMKKDKCAWLFSKLVF
ncbi:hypothetical protein EDEG_01614 [Edhazardia aedis USNM 41457]|uniref:60S ribosomal protein L27 n=1 Tax=Edhazardia aedis (strain USNM 41457) TaxID=1003232 RepID=J9DS26_EDHAE|nr:hypothetical protein EDEG_01614 [Edhazardia aedis USNM 41457]|eukprot:EJW04092.1 hypothetical protein EDEG_01614 [Edhazardia aedis USNM 41457]